MRVKCLKMKMKIVVHINLCLWCFLSVLELDSDWKVQLIYDGIVLRGHVWKRAMWKYLLCLCFDDTITFSWTIPLRGLVKKYERLLLRILVCFFSVQPRASCSLLLKRAASVFEAFEEINPKFQCCKICICDHMKTAQIQMQLEPWQRHNTDHLSNCG